MEAKPHSVTAVWSDTPDDELMLVEVGVRAACEGGADQARRALKGAAAERRAQARNPRTPAPVLEHLAAHGTLDVLEAVAGNPSCPPHVLERLATGSRDVAAAVARNPSSPPAAAALASLST